LNGALLADAAGDGAQAAAYRQQAAALRTAINDYLWDPALGAYDASTSERGFVTQDANAFAVLYGIAPAGEVPTILAAMKARLGTQFGDQRASTPAPGGYNQDVSPFMGSYDLWARLAAGDTADAMSLLTQEWGYMAGADPPARIGNAFSRTARSTAAALAGRTAGPPGPRARCPATCSA
jgi:alpha-L-rhamnosidase